ncbi:molybdopterin-dependent oxidoreductase [Chloroflexota bacterium]
MEKTVMVAHCTHCGGSCLLKVHVKGGIISRIETDDGEEPQYRACARGRAFRQRVYAADRILYPLKRAGERGTGEFERISWDEALDTVAGQLTRVRDTYGPASIIFKFSMGDAGQLQNVLHRRLLNMAGGCSEVWGVASAEGAIFNQIATFGTDMTMNSREDLKNSKMIILWSCNPADTIQWTNTTWYLKRAREAGIKIVCVDPKYTNTAATCASQWIPIRPGTDAAMLIAMAYVVVAQNLQDRQFLDTHTVGFEKYRDYLMGKEDGVPKTPAWAEAITGVPSSTIERLARDYATTKPAALVAGLAAGRTAFGEQYHRAATTLAAMTGNIGVHGGDTAAAAFGPPFDDLSVVRNLGRGIEVPVNPVEAKSGLRNNAFAGYENMHHRTGHVHTAKVADAILKGKKGGYPADYKLLYLVNTSFPNQYPNINRNIEAMKSPNLEFIVMCEQFMTPGAKFADIILPVNTCMERNDIIIGTAPTFYGFTGQCIDSIGQSRSHLDICTELAAKLGLTDFNTKTEDEWLRQVATGGAYITDYAEFKKAGVHRVKSDKPSVAFMQNIEHPAENPFPTPSGKIEIYSERLENMGDPLIPAVPKYIETWESPNDALAEKYPLQLITTHIWRRAHSQYDTIGWLSELEPQAIWINPADALSRGIKDSDMVSVFNARGVIVMRAKVTERIMPGVVDIPEGAWYNPDADGTDRGGSANVLTLDESSPGGAFPTNTSLVQVEKA